MKNSILAAIAATALSLGAPALGADLSEEEIKALALQAILENPEIVMQAVEILRERETAEKAAAAANVLDDQADAIYRDANAVVLGNPNGDVTVVEFFDYNCGFCKRATPAVKALLESDPNLRVVMREFPILSEGSIYAAKAALAAREQGKYSEFHFALMGLPRADEKSVMRAAKKMGLDTEKLAADMDSEIVEEHIATSRNLSEALGFTGTPSFVIGTELVPGFLPLEGMQDIIKEQRMAQK